MKRVTKTFLTVLVAVLLLTTAPATFAKPNNCTTIQSGELVDSTGEVIEVGYDQWGYNYQARKFRGGYCDSYRDAAWCQPWADVDLMMKWNSAWLDNKDCDDNGLLDRHFGYASYIGSGAWLTNHQDGEYEQDGQTCNWNYFVKIAAAPDDAVAIDGVWYTVDGEVIGDVIWGAFAVIQEVSNDACADEHGLAHKGQRPGLGNW